jgi:hypothetical protein
LLAGAAGASEGVGKRKVAVVDDKEFDTGYGPEAAGLS